MTDTATVERVAEAMVNPVLGIHADSAIQKTLRDMDGEKVRWMMEAARAGIEEHLAVLADAGLVVVPQEPTAEMVDVGTIAWAEEKDPMYIYRAMIDAAPKKP